LATVILTGVTASAQDPGDSKHVEQIKREAAAIGDGGRVSLKLRNNRKITGHLNYVGDDFLQITDDKSKASVKVPYADVVQIERKKEKSGLSTKAKIALGVIGGLFVMGMVANGGG
jgi:hypothetical protein